MPQRTPDLTAAQWLALVKWIVAQFVAWHWLSSTPSQVALSVAATVLAGAWVWADAHIRGRRAAVAAAAIYSAAQRAPAPAPPGP